MEPTCEGHWVWGKLEPNGSQSVSSELKAAQDQEIVQILKNVHVIDDSDSSRGRPEVRSNSEIRKLEDGPTLSRPPPNLTLEQQLVMHDAGKCKPCFFAQSGLCERGASCTYCHLPHTKKEQPFKAVRDLCKQVAGQRLADGVSNSREELMRTARALAQQGGYMRTVVEGMIKQREGTSQTLVSL